MIAGLLLVDVAILISLNVMNGKINVIHVGSNPAFSAQGHLNISN
jgi:hypothetical protein